MTTKGSILRQIDVATLGLYDLNTYEFNLQRAETSTVWIFNTHATNDLNYRLDLAPGADGETWDTGNWLWQEDTATNAIVAGAAAESILIDEGWAMRGRIQIDDDSAHADAIVTCVGALADDTVTVNGLVYTAVAGTKADNTEFSIDGTDAQDAADLADSMTNDTRTGVTVPAEDFTGSDSTNAVTVTAKVGGTAGNGIDISSSTGVRLAITGDTAGFLDGGTDLFSSFHIFVVNTGTW